jgi:hypothetical protein
MKLKTENVAPLLLIAGGILAWKYAIAPALETVGLKDSAADKTQSHTENLTISKDYWNPTFYQKPPAGYGSIMLTSAYADKLARQLYDSAGWFNDDEEAIYAAFRQCTYKSQVSFLVQRFYELYKQDLYTWLRDSVLNTSELNTVLTITNKLPNGYKNLQSGRVI